MTQLTGAPALARTFVGYGVSHIFVVSAVMRRTLAEAVERGSSRAAYRWAT